MPSKARALHYVFRVGSIKASYEFYGKLLGMKVLRYEEFEGGCLATCNGPYGGDWSKTMIGYGDEDDQFVMELTYNYGICSYELGNDYRAIHVESDEALENVKSSSKAQKLEDGSYLINDPDGHPFHVSGGAASRITKVSLNVKDIPASKEFWNTLCEMPLVSETKDQVTFSFGKNQVQLELNALNGAELRRGTAFGRIAFATPAAEQPGLQAKVQVVNPHYIQTPLVMLDTPGKRTVRVVILRDPNDHEVCFVEDEGYTELSHTDPHAETALREAISKH